MSDEQPTRLTLREIIRLAVLDAVERNGGNKCKAAEELKMGRTTLYRKWNEYAKQSISTSGVGDDRDHPGSSGS